MERLSTLVNEEAILPAVCFNIVGEIPSCLFDFETSSDSNNWCTLFSVHNNDSWIGLLWCWIHFNLE